MRAPSKTHLCRAFRCTAEVDRKKLFCQLHWDRLSRRMQDGMSRAMNNPGAHEALVLCIDFIRRVEDFRHE